MTAVQGGAATGRIGAGRLKWWHGMAAGMLIMASPGAGLLLGVLSAPALLVVAADTTRGRVLSRTVMLFLLAGVIVPARQFLFDGHSLAAAFEILENPGTILFTWILGACGWLVTEIFSFIAVFAQGRRHDAETRVLQARMQEIRAEWEFDDL